MLLSATAGPQSTEHGTFWNTRCILDIKGEFQAKTHAPLIDPFCHINLPGRQKFCQSCLYFHTRRTPQPAPPPAYNGSQLSSHLVLLGGQLRECSRYGSPSISRLISSAMLIQNPGQNITSGRSSSCTD